MGFIGWAVTLQGENQIHLSISTLAIIRAELRHRLYRGEQAPLHRHLVLYRPYGIARRVKNIMTL